MLIRSSRKEPQPAYMAFMPSLAQMLLPAFMAPWKSPKAFEGQRAGWARSLTDAIRADCN